jgi:hydroxymethylpyrimidine pyrophosphatase-like HAD family hydrolase
MRPLILVDLDDTLFQSRRKCPIDVAPDDLSALGFARDGAPLGFATPRQIAFLSWLSETSLLVPITGRGREALSRVRIPFSTAICAHGGVILNGQGEPDMDWSQRIASEATPYAATLAELMREAIALATSQSSGTRARLVTEGSADLYLLLKHEQGDVASLGALVDLLAPHVAPDWTIHRNGNNAALMPPFLSKAKAVRALLPRLREQYPQAPAIGIGDSLTDAPFMGLCDYAMMPVGSQLGTAALGTLT